jgi:hypothetical protein
MEKESVVRALLASLQVDVDGVVAAAKATHDAATHPEAKPESDKDTRALEAGYLAGAQSARAAELQAQCAAVERAVTRGDWSAFRLVTYREGKATHTVLVSKWGGGQRFVVDGVTVQAITDSSPLGAVLVDVSADDVGEDVDVDMGARVRSLRIVTAA